MRSKHACRRSGSPCEGGGPAGNDAPGPGSGDAVGWTRLPADLGCPEGSELTAEDFDARKSGRRFVRSPHLRCLV